METSSEQAFYRRVAGILAKAADVEVLALLVLALVPGGEQGALTVGKRIMAGRTEPYTDVEQRLIALAVIERVYQIGAPHVARPALTLVRKDVLE